MLKNAVTTGQDRIGEQGGIPSLDITKLGIVSRDYTKQYDGRRDFSHVFPGVLKLLDRKGCDAVLFSLYSIIPRESLDLFASLNGLKRITAVFLEEFQDRPECTVQREAKRYVVYHLSKEQWQPYELHQKFGSLARLPKNCISDFVSVEMPKKILGRCCVLLCGESNGVKYAPKDKKVTDIFGVRAAIPTEVNIVLNPAHDRMTRFEMKLKRSFLSKGGRWVVSVWNKGKADKTGTVKDGHSPAWTVFHDGEEKRILPVQNELGVEIGILDVEKA